MEQIALTSSLEHYHPLVDGLDACARFGLAPDPPRAGSVVGIADNALTGERPLHGLRHPPEGNSNGWYIWAGELSADADFFKPVHVEHIDVSVPAALPYLSLPAGWRFLIAPEVEDVWEDPSLLKPAS